MATINLPSTSFAFPWMALIRASGKNLDIDILPRVTITRGLMASICRSKYFPQARISSGNGSRFSGGRHFTTLQMKTPFLSNPAFARRSLNSLPAAPTKGLPCSFSLNPGPSPMNIISALGGPSPGTDRLRVL